MDIIQQFAAIVAKRVVAQLKNGQSKQAGRKLDMNCRAPHCKQRSKGPRYRYMCGVHRAALTLTEQRKALASYNARKSG